MYRFTTICGLRTASKKTLENSEALETLRFQGSLVVRPWGATPRRPLRAQPQGGRGNKDHSILKVSLLYLLYPMIGE